MAERQSSFITGFLLHDPSTQELYRKATQAPFLSLGGQGKLPKDNLSQWLSQDRLYAQAYLRFIGGLMSRVHLPQAVGSEQSTTGSLEWRIMSMLYNAMGAVRTELQFYEKTAVEYGLDLVAKVDGGKDDEFGPNEITKACIVQFDSYTAEAAGPRRTLLQGLVFLWTLEKVYLDAWMYAKDQGERTGESTGEEDLDGGALRNAFIPNWTSEQFAQFVGDIRACLDEYTATCGGNKAQKIAMEVWKECLVLEEGFWPKV